MFINKKNRQQSQYNKYVNKLKTILTQLFINIKANNHLEQKQHLKLIIEEIFILQCDHI